MRVPVLEYVALALSTGLGHSASGPPSEEVALPGVTINDPRCWASSSGVSASYGPLKDLRTDAVEFCNVFTTNQTGSIVISSGKFIFGWQSATFVGNFASRNSCLDTFNTLVTVCYGTVDPTHPIHLGGTIVDPGGANLAISFGNGAQF